MELILIAALAALWLWRALGLPGLPWYLRAPRAGVVALPRGEHFLRCPWCLGAWLAIAFLTALHWATGQLHPVITPISALAAAGLVGLAASFLPDDGEPT